MAAVGLQQGEGNTGKGRCELGFGLWVRGCAVQVRERERCKLEMCNLCMGEAI